MPTTFCIDLTRDDRDFSRGVAVIVIPGVEKTIFKICVMFMLVIEVVVFDLVSL